MLGAEFPICAFSHCRDVVAAVTNAGGFGILGATAHSPHRLQNELAWIEEQTGGQAAVPDSPVQHAMIVDKVPLLAPPGNTQNAAHRALPGRQQGPQQQYLSMTPRPLLHKHLRER